ncbi:hypothetical protein [Nocardia sp. NPDC058480]|uniref:hypothetical protein n=1 Tax=unclassified Nocardia TaxID=2637762 RepID=UPI0036604B86
MTDPRPPAFTADILVTMRGVGDSIGLPYTVNPMELVDREALVELREGPAGPPGEEGEAAWPWLWQGDIADPAALRALGLTTSDARKAWRVVAEDAVYVWTGLEFIGFANAFANPGHKGPPNRLTGSGVAGPTSSSAAAQVTGAAPGQRVEITFPRGETGDPGDLGVAGRIQDAADVLVDSTRPLGQDYVLAWDAALDKFVPRPGPRLAGPWAIGQGQMVGGSHLSDQVKVLASMTIPGQPMSWRPLVSGYLAVTTEGARGESKCNIEVRIDGVDGELVARGHGTTIPGIGSGLVASEFQYPISPDSTVGVVPANRTIVLYILVRRIVGTARYTVATNNAQIIVRAQPV